MDLEHYPRLRTQVVPSMTLKRMNQLWKQRGLICRFVTASCDIMMPSIHFTIIVILPIYFIHISFMLHISLLGSCFTIGKVELMVKVGTGIKWAWSVRILFSFFSLKPQLMIFHSCLFRAIWLQRGFISHY